MTQDDITEFARALRKRPPWKPGPGTRRVSLGRVEIGRLLPHAGPAVMIDEITALDPGESAIAARRRIATGDPIFEWHFPGDPVYPGVLLGEAVGQAAACAHQLMSVGWCERSLPERPSLTRVTRIHRADFTEAVRPGDELAVLAKLLDVGTLTVLFAGAVLRGGRICATLIAELLILNE